MAWTHVAPCCVALGQHLEPHLCMTLILGTCAAAPGESRLAVEARAASRPCWLLGSDTKDMSREQRNPSASATGVPEGACPREAASCELLQATHGWVCNDMGPSGP